MNTLYTANIGGYDILTPLVQLEPGWRAVYITDGDAPPGWEVVSVHTCNPVETSKHCKIKPEEYIGAHDVSVWIDANLTVDGSLNSLIAQYTNEYVALTHPFKHTFYEEIEACKKHPRKYLRGKEQRLNALAATAREQGMPDDDGNSVENRVVIRRPSSKLNELQDLWWQELQKPFGCLKPVWRDQLALRVAAWKLKYSLAHGIAWENWFLRGRHGEPPVSWT